MSPLSPPSVSVSVRLFELLLRPPCNRQTKFRGMGRLFLGEEEEFSICTSSVAFWLPTPDSSLLHGNAPVPFNDARSGVSYTIQEEPDCAAVRFVISQRALVERRKTEASHRPYGADKQATGVEEGSMGRCRCCVPGRGASTPIYTIGHWQCGPDRRQGLKRHDSRTTRRCKASMQSHRSGFRRFCYTIRNRLLRQARAHQRRQPVSHLQHDSDACPATLPASNTGMQVPLRHSVHTAFLCSGRTLDSEHHQ